jgi:hypothetical protein
MKKNITQIASWSPASYPAYPAYESGVGSYYYYFPVEVEKDTDDKG